MNITFYDKTALVTGSTVGIGYATALELARSGAQVTLNGRSRASVDKALASLRAEVPDARVDGVAADLATAEGCETLLAHLPSVDILVNNMGIYGTQDFFEIDDAEWERFFQTNVMSGIRLARAYTPAMVDKGWGRVVFVSSESGLNIPTEMIHYGFTKTANLSVARGLAKRLSGTGVTVNSVLPGPTLSEGVSGLLQRHADAQGITLDDAAAGFVKAKRPSSIIQRVADPAEVANMIVYAVSEAASATTGAALRVDGGIVDSLV